MVHLYLDSSSLVKLYLQEVFSEETEAWVKSAQELATSSVAYPEVLSALTRRRNMRMITEDAFQKAVLDFRRSWFSMLSMPVHEWLAGELVLKHTGLRGFDAVHLAAALTLRIAAKNNKFAFSSFDERLNAAAEKEGLSVLRPKGKKK